MLLLVTDKCLADYTVSDLDYFNWLDEFRSEMNTR